MTGSVWGPRKCKSIFVRFVFFPCHLFAVMCKGYRERMSQEVFISKKAGKAFFERIMD